MAHLLADEHIARSTVQMLRNLGHDVKWVVEEGLQGVDDEILYQKAVAEKRIILTFDPHFSQMAYASQEWPAGAIVLRFKPRNTGECNERLRLALDAVGILEDKLIIISRYRIRVRPLPARPSPRITLAST